MTRGPARDGPGRDATQAIRTPRFRLKETYGGGHVDGAWWPHSDDLTAELPGLIEGLALRLGAIGRVFYNKTEWRLAPAELVGGKGVVRLDRYGGQPPNTVEVVDYKGNKTALLVIPFHIDPERAHSIVTAAAAPGDEASVDALLMISAQDRECRTTRDAARERWDSHGTGERPMPGPSQRPAGHSVGQHDHDKRRPDRQRLP